MKLMMKSGARWLCVAVLQGTLSLVGCGSDSSTVAFGSSNVPSRPSADPSSVPAATPTTSATSEPRPPVPVRDAGAPAALSSSSEKPYDPNVKFDWPESVPSTGACLPGTYTGQFTCVLNPGGIFPPGTVTGPVTFQLQQSSSGEFLEIKDGTLTGQTTGVTFTSPLGGKLDCSKNTFHADATNGTFGVPPFSGTFAGTLDGKLDRPTQTLTGTWSLTATGSNLPCIGPWSAVRQP